MIAANTLYSDNTTGNGGKVNSEQANEAKEAKADAIAAKAKAKALRPWYVKKRVIVPVALVLLIGVNSAINSGGSSVNTADETVKSEESSGTEETSNTEATAEASTETQGQANAKKSAESYLAVSAFSKEGLIDQLKFEDYSQEDAEYAVEALDVDWKEQAAKSAAA